MKELSMNVKIANYLVLPIMALCALALNDVAIGRTGRTCQTFSNRGFLLAANPFKYSGYYRDSESKMRYLKARYYSPKLARFISKDTCDLSNRYAYCDENPIGKFDPNGHNALNTLTSSLGVFSGGIVSISLFLTLLPSHPFITSLAFKPVLLTLGFNLLGLASSVVNLIAISQINSATGSHDWSINMDGVNFWENIICASTLIFGIAALSCWNKSMALARAAAAKPAKLEAKAAAQAEEDAGYFADDEASADENVTNEPYRAVDAAEKQLDALTTTSVNQPIRVTGQSANFRAAWVAASNIVGALNSASAALVFPEWNATWPGDQPDVSPYEPFL